MFDLLRAKDANALRATATRTRAAKAVFWGCAFVSLTGAILHIILRLSSNDNINWLYFALTAMVGVSALVSLRFLPKSLQFSMRTMYIGGTISVCGMVAYALREDPTDPLYILILFPAGVFAWGLILGFRSAVQYSFVSAVVIIALGIVFNRVIPAFVYSVVSIIFTFPARIVEQLIEESTAELSRVNLQLRGEISVRKQAEAELQKHRDHLEEMVEQRTAQLQQEVVERKRAAEELQKRNQELDAFAHTVAHDLKNPLAAIIGFSDLLEVYFGASANENQHQCITAISQYSRKMSNLVQELLLLASVRKMDEVPLSPVDMRAVLTEALERLSYLVNQQKAEFQVQDEWPMITSYGPWLEEVWVNYLSNAIKYGGQPPRIELGADELTEPETGRPLARFWVRDNGDGLTAAEQASLFTPFTQLHQVDLKGHGLGLSIVQRIVHRLGGEVGLESQHGQGSTFSFTFPLSVSQPASAPAAEESVLAEQGRN